MYYKPRKYKQKMWITEENNNFQFMCASQSVVRSVMTHHTSATTEQSPTERHKTPVVHTETQLTSICETINQWPGFIYRTPEINHLYIKATKVHTYRYMNIIQIHSNDINKIYMRREQLEREIIKQRILYMNLGVLGLLWSCPERSRGGDTPPDYQMNRCRLS